MDKAVFNFSVFLYLYLKWGAHSEDEMKWFRRAEVGIDTWFDMLTISDASGVAKN